MHSELSETIYQIPASIAVLLGDETGKMDGLGKSRAQVLLFDEYVLKIRPAGDWNTVDVQILQWLAGKAPAPEVAAHEVRNGQDWLLMTRLRGKELCKPDVMNNPVKSWLKEEQAVNDLKYETLLKLYFGGVESKDVTIHNIEVFEEQARKDLAVLKTYKENLEKVLDQNDHLYYYLTVTLGMETYEAYLKWCDQAKTMLKSFDGGE